MRTPPEQLVQLLLLALAAAAFGVIFVSADQQDHEAAFALIASIITGLVTRPRPSPPA